MTFCSMLWDIFLAAVGVAIGYFAAVFTDRDNAKKAFLEGHNRSMNALFSSLKRNSDYIKQMFTHHFPAGEYPSYPLDTTGLALINFGLHPYLPPNTDWPAKFNHLRFEMEHINRKLLMNYLAGTPVPSNEIKVIYGHYNTTGQMPPDMPAHALAGIVSLLLDTKTKLDEQTQEM